MWLLLQACVELADREQVLSAFGVSGNSGVSDSGGSGGHPMAFVNGTAQQSALDSLFWTGFGWTDLLQAAVAKLSDAQRQRVEERLFAALRRAGRTRWHMSLVAPLPPGYDAGRSQLNGTSATTQLAGVELLAPEALLVVSTARAAVRPWQPGSFNVGLQVAFSPLVLGAGC